MTTNIISVYSCVFMCLAEPCDITDEIVSRDILYLRRGLYQLIASIASNNVLELVTSVGADMLNRLLAAVTEGATDVSDASVTFYIYIKIKCYVALKSYCALKGIFCFSRRRPALVSSTK